MTHLFSDTVHQTEQNDDPSEEEKNKHLSYFSHWEYLLYFSLGVSSLP